MARKNQGEGTSTAKPKSIYHLFREEEGGRLSPIGTHEGRNAEDAVSAHLKENPDENGDRPFVIVPARNLSRVQVEVQHVTKVKLNSVA